MVVGDGGSGGFLGEGDASFCGILDGVCIRCG